MNSAPRIMQGGGGSEVYNVTMLQDKNPALIEQKHSLQTAKLLPKLKLDSHSNILDLACGVGRWLDAIPFPIARYRGIDFSPTIIELARSRNTKPNAEFFTGSVLDAGSIFANERGTFNRVLMIGLLNCLNDGDIPGILADVSELCVSEGALLCVNASVGIDERLTLKEFYSEELHSDYESIYRTRDEYMKFFEDTLIPAGFSVTDEGATFDGTALRSETTQHYFILER